MFKLQTCVSSKLEINFKECGKQVQSSSRQFTTGTCFLAFRHCNFMQYIKYKCQSGIELRWSRTNLLHNTYPRSSVRNAFSICWTTVRSPQRFFSFMSSQWRGGLDKIWQDQAHHLSGSHLGFNATWLALKEEPPSPMLVEITKEPALGPATNANSSGLPKNGMLLWKLGIESERVDQYCTPTQ